MRASSVSEQLTLHSRIRCPARIHSAARECTCSGSQILLFSPLLRRGPIAQDTKKGLSLTASVLYTNTLSIPIVLAILVPTGDAAIARDLPWSIPAIAALVFSSVIGTCIGYSGWWCRTKISATSFTVVGVVNKLSTVLINQIMWSKHASALGVVGLLLALVGGVLYRQAPMRTTAANPSTEVEDKPLLPTTETNDGENGENGKDAGDD